MLGNHANNFSEGVKFHIDFETETKGDDIREEIKDNSIIIVSYQINTLKCHAQWFQKS